jgi:hypothetical protein
MIVFLNLSPVSLFKMEIADFFFLAIKVLSSPTSNKVLS